VAPDAELEHDQSALFPGNCQTHNQSGTRSGAEVHNAVRRQGIKELPEDSATLQQQAQNNTLAQFSASPDLHSEFLTAVIGAMDS